MYGTYFQGESLAYAASADPNADSFLVVPHSIWMNTDTGRLKIEKVGVEFEAR